MARESEPPLLSYIHNARSHAEQIGALRSLKNDIVGHTQRKEYWVLQGALEPVVAILQSSRLPRKANAKSRRPSVESQQLSEEESVRLQALQVLSSFANGGSSFVDPIVASGAGPAILANISPNSNPPTIVTTALKALVNIAEATSHSNASDSSEAKALADQVFSAQSIHALGNICAQSSAWKTSPGQSAVALVATLVTRLCQDEKHALCLAESDVLDMLARELASFAVAGGYVIPGAEVAGRSDGRAAYIPEPASAGTSLALVLEALTTIVSDSRYRASRLLCSPAILAVFPSLGFMPPAGGKAPWPSVDPNGHQLSRQPSTGAMEYLLPAVPRPQGRNPGTSSPFPPLGSSDRRESSFAFSRSSLSKFGQGLPVVDASQPESPAQSGDSEEDDLESPLVPWLIVLTRTRSSLERLMAASLLASLFRSGLGTKYTRESSIGLLVVPLMVHMVQHYDANHQTKSQIVDSSTSLTWTVLERGPAVISRLITDREALQKAAFDCGAVKTFSKLLKDAYEPLSTTGQPKMWSPHPDTGMDAESSSSACRLGSPGASPLLAHRIRLRESALKAISALAAGKDEYRKAFVDQDIMPCIVQSLSMTPTSPSTSKDRTVPDEPDGPAPDAATSGYGSNPLSVVIAACHAVRMLSRSISILRTTLVDYGVSLPVFRFLKHPDVDVQVAATAAVCNLVTEVSPMRETLADKGAMKILCEHAHSHTAALRLNALWALKHFVNAVSPRAKKECLEELESGWLVRLICDDTEDDALCSARAKSEKQVEPDIRGDDVDGDVEMGQNDVASRSWYGRGIPRDAEGKPAGWAVQAEAKMAALREAELNPQRRARNDDLAIQEQGLDFIRNMIGATGSVVNSELPNESTEMIDHLFTVIGQDRFFDILAKKLQAKMLQGGGSSSRRSAVSGATNGASGGAVVGTAAAPGAGTTAAPSGSEARILYPQCKIVEAVVYILVHMAASVPRHRQLVIAQPALLRLLGAHFASRDKEVRVALCHLINNLTWQDDEGDARACGLRAHELKKLGFLGKLEGLEEDGELDVRERARTAVWQMKQVSAA